jgi:hypothetical protein
MSDINSPDAAGLRRFLRIRGRAKVEPVAEPVSEPAEPIAAAPMPSRDRAWLKRPRRQSAGARRRRKAIWQARNKLGAAA